MPALDWLYNSNTGVVAEMPDPVATVELHLGIGWHGPFNTHDDAINYYNTNKAANPGWKAPIGLDPGKAISNAASSAGNDVKSWFSSNAETLILRIGEVLLGLVLIGIGVASITGAGNFISKAVKSRL